MRSSRISEVCGCATAGSLKSAHAQQQDLRSLAAARTSEIFFLLMRRFINFAAAHAQTFINFFAAHAQT
jgi:hypothetical protein